MEKARSTDWVWEGFRGLGENEGGGERCEGEGGKVRGRGGERREKG